MVSRTNSVKKRAKVRLFFQSTKFFCKKSEILVYFLYYSYLCGVYLDNMRYKESLLLLLLVFIAQLSRADDDVTGTLISANEEFFDPEALKNKKKDDYRFSVEYRVMVGYQQTQHRTENLSYENMYLHGGRLGLTVDFLLPKRWSVQTGAYYSLVYGSTVQNWGPINMEDYAKPDPKTGKAHSGEITHRLYEHTITVPVHTYYNIHLWKDLNLVFYTGPQLQIGAAMRDEMYADISDAAKKWMKSVGQPYKPYDRYAESELMRCGVQWSLGGGIEWGKIRLQAGYDFGLNNLVKVKKVPNQQMWEWGWQVGLSFRF